MDVEINYLAVFLAGLSSLVVGSIWYAKPVFGKTWQDMVKLKDEQMKQGAGKAIGLSFIASLVMAYVLAHVAYLSDRFFTGNSFLHNSFATAFWLWLGIAATTIIVHDLFEQRRSKLTLLNIGNQLVTLLAMGLIIGALGV